MGDELSSAVAEDGSCQTSRSDAVRILRMKSPTGEVEFVGGPGDPLIEWYQSADSEWEA